MKALYISIFTLASLFTTSTLAKNCSKNELKKIRIKNIITCHTVKGVQIVQYLSEQSGVSVGLFKNGKETQKQDGFGEFPKLISHKDKKVKAAILDQGNSKYSYIFRSYYGPIEGIYILNFDFSDAKVTITNSRVFDKEGEENNLIPVRPEEKVSLKLNQIQIEKRAKFNIDFSKTTEI